MHTCVELTGRGNHGYRTERKEAVPLTTLFTSPRVSRIHHRLKRDEAPQLPPLKKNKLYSY